MRRLVAFGAVTGAPGVTTTALIVAAVWPPTADDGVRPVMVEADPSGGDLMVRAGLPPAPSLLDVAATVGSAHPGSLLGGVSELPCGVRAVVALPGRTACRDAVRLLGGEAGRRVLRGDAHDRGTVLLDAGRLMEDVEPLLTAADHVVLVARGGADSLTHVAASGLTTDSYARRLTLTVVGPSPYSTEEITTALGGVEDVVFLPWDARTTARLNQRGTRKLTATRGLWPPPLLSAARSLARRLASLDGDHVSTQPGATTCSGLVGPVGPAGPDPAPRATAPDGRSQPNSTPEPGRESDESRP